MSRVSQEELYNDKDVVTQILKLKDTVNDYAGGIIENIDVSGNDLVIDWADGTSVSLTLPSPTGISSVTGAVSGGNLIITFYMTDGSSHAFTTPLTGIATLDTEQTFTAKKIFDVSPEVPTTPATPISAVNSVYVNDPTEGVNNIGHKSGNESFDGDKNYLRYIGGRARDMGFVRNTTDAERTAGTIWFDAIDLSDGTMKGIIEGYSRIEYFRFVFGMAGQTIYYAKFLERTDNTRRVILAISPDDGHMHVYVNQPSNNSGSGLVLNKVGDAYNSAMNIRRFTYTGSDTPIAEPMTPTFSYVYEVTI